MNRASFRRSRAAAGIDGASIGLTKSTLEARRAKRRAHNKVAKAARKGNRS